MTEDERAEEEQGRLGTLSLALFFYGNNVCSGLLPSLKTCNWYLKKRSTRTPASFQQSAAIDQLRRLESNICQIEPVQMMSCCYCLPYLVTELQTSVSRGENLTKGCHRPSTIDHVKRSLNTTKFNQRGFDSARIGLPSFLSLLTCPCRQRLHRPWVPPSRLLPPRLLLCCRLRPGARGTPCSS